ncbi:hypothetical protein MAP00_000784 [Monascus purpureus]|nr:hypothetical protein MAP00_000784 [Monascus purpureus]
MPQAMLLARSMTCRRLRSSQPLSNGVSWKDIDLDFQRVGVPKENPDSQLSSTTYLRMFAQAKDAQTVGRVPAAWMWNSMQHYAGMHRTLHAQCHPNSLLGILPGYLPPERTRRGR